MTVTLDTIGLVVRDMGKALAFYRLLGLELPAEADHEPHVEYEPSSGCSIGFVSEAMVRETDPKWDGSFGHGVNLQFRFDSGAEVDAAHDRLTAAGFTSYQAPWDAFWGQRFARIVDPDGNVVNLFAPLPA